MNAITQTATQAIATLETAAPAQNLILVPLSQLRPSRRNVRKTAGQSIDALAASIARVGLLQNLTVILASDGENYEVVAGGRRLAALKLLAKKRRIPKDWDVPCLLVADGRARTVSLTEKVQRRLKLANVSPRLMADYRADAVTLDQLTGLAITDDHTAQEAAFYDAPTWQRSPSALRERLTEREIDAYRHPLVRFVGLDAYEQADSLPVACNRSEAIMDNAAILGPCVIGHPMIIKPYFPAMFAKPRRICSPRMLK